MIKRVFIVLITIIFVSQANKSFSQNPLIGAWDVYCVVDNSGENSISFCDFCAFKLSDDQKSISFNILKLKVTVEKLNFTRDESTKSIDYSYNEKESTIEFTYLNQEYSFIVLTIMDVSEGRYILQNKDSSLVYLEKAKE